MTTPERLRRRQRIETALVGLLMVVVAVSELNENRENDRQDACLYEQVTALTETLTVRGEIAQRESDNTAAVLLLAAEARSDEEIARGLKEYAKKRHEILEERRVNPIPPFPSGKCDNGGG